MNQKQVDPSPEQRIEQLERTVSDLSRALRKEKQTADLLEAIRKAQALFIADADKETIYPLLLKALIDITDSEYGFLDEVVADETGQISKKNLALSNIAWDGGSRRLYRQLQDRDMRFTYLDNLAGLPALSGQPVIANDPIHDTRSKGIPDGHPPIHSYMGLPLFFGGQLIGVAGVANRREGYTMEIARFLEPLLSTCAGITYALRTQAAEKGYIDKLKRNRNQLQAFLDAIPESAFLMQTDGTVLALNRTTANRLQQQPEEILGKNIYDFIPDNVGQRRKRLVQKAIAKGQCVRFEDERYGRTMYNSISPVVDDPRHATRLAVVGIDLSGAINVKRRLEEREAQYRTIVETANEGIWVMDRDYRTTYVNTVMLDMLGYRSKEEMLGRPVTDFMFPDQLPDFRERMERMHARETDVYERRLRKKDGTELWAIVSARSRFNEKDEFDGSFAMFTDISERKQAEKKLRLHEVIVQSALEPMAVIDRDYRFVLVNNSYESFWTLDRSTIIGRKVPDIIGREVFERTVKPMVDRCLSGEQVRYRSWFASPSLGRRYMHLNYTPYRDPDGTIVGLINIAYDTTEQRLAEEALQLKEKMLARTEAIAHIGSWEWDIAADSMTWSAELFRIFNLDPAGGAPSFAEHPRLYPAEDMRRLGRSVQRTIETGEPYDVSLRSVRSDGEIRHCRVQGFPERDTAGKVVRLYGFLQDETDRHLALRKVEQLAHDQSAILDNISAYIYFKDTENNIIRISESVARVTGLPKSDIEGRHSSEIYPETADRYWADDLEVITAGKPKLGIIEPLPTTDGDERWLLTDKVPYYDDSGRVAGVIVMASDITEKVFAEKRLEASEKKFRSLFENAADAVYLLSPDGCFLDVNAAAQRQNGYSREALLQMRVEDLDPQAEPKKDQETLWPSLHPGESAVISRRHRRRDGSFFPVEINLSAMELSGETVIIAFCRDVTATTEMQKQLRQAQKMESIGNLAGGIAHDFNNLLYPMIGMAEMLMEDLPPESLKYDNAAEIYSAGIRAAELVRQILAFSRKTKIQKQPIRLQTVINEALKLARATIPNDIGIHPVIQADCGEVMADATQMQQVAINLLTNAYHAVMETSGEITIRLREVRLKTERARSLSLSPGSYALLSVIDNGYGIDPSLTEKIFDPYFTTKAPGGGTGLGLAVVYGIVKDHGGGVHVDSENGKGTTFDVYLPVTAPQTTEEAPAEAPAAEGLQGTERILLVDDEAPILKLLKNTLEKLGYRVTACSSGVAALSAFNANPDNFDMVISDMAMPKMTGVELARQIQSIRSDIPIIICTGYSERIDSQRAADLGIRRLLTKPIDRSELIDTIRRTLDGPPLGTDGSSTSRG